MSKKESKYPAKYARFFTTAKINFSNKGTREEEFALIDVGMNGERNGVSFIYIHNIFEGQLSLFSRKRSYLIIYILELHCDKIYYFYYLVL